MRGTEVEWLSVCTAAGQKQQISDRRPNRSSTMLVQVLQDLNSYAHAPVSRATPGP